MGPMHRVRSMLSATTPLLTSPKLTPKTMPLEAYRGRIASVKLRRKRTRQRVLGERVTYITCQKGTWVRLVKNLTLRGSNEEPRSLPREEKGTSPYLLFIYYKLRS
jgi:hypothetical protein